MLIAAKSKLPEAEGSVDFISAPSSDIVIFPWHKTCSFLRNLPVTRKVTPSRASVGGVCTVTTMCHLSKVSSN